MQTARYPSRCVSYPLPTDLGLVLFEVTGVVEPGSGGCLDALYLEGTSRARVAPTPRPPVERRGAVLIC